VLGAELPQPENASTTPIVMSVLRLGFEQQPAVRCTLHCLCGSFGGDSRDSVLGELRFIYRLPTEEAAERLDVWLAWASRCRLKPFVKLARTIRQHKPGVLAAIELNLSNECLSYCTSC
jgi:Transposase